MNPTILRRDTQGRGFTLIELLVVIAIIALLLSILLPSLAKVRLAARDLKCQITQRSLAQAIQLYLDDQKDPVWFDLNPRSPFADDYWNVMKTLDDYVSGSAEAGAFVCPSARGELSVTFPGTRDYLEGAGRIFVYDYDGDQVDEFTEYWFNDSPLKYYNASGAEVPDPGQATWHSGVSRQLLRGIEHPEEVVWLTDAYDEAPRHQGKNNFTFGDHRVRALSLDEYYEEFASDKYGAPGPFFNWGHYYPDRH